MAIKVYGSTVCPATMRFLSILTENGVMPTFVNVTGSIDHLQEFITFRDKSNLFDNVRGTGSIGFPLIWLEDGTVTRDVNQVLKNLGIKTKMEFK
ncbi:MAG: hypothetical protein IJH47_06780 [Oscillospiraceae bacterium]|nr:hypothetical protein [Oscillospiraceae bacterium]